MEVRAEPVWLRLPVATVTRSEVALKSNLAKDRRPVEAENVSTEKEECAHILLDIHLRRSDS